MVLRKLFHPLWFSFVAILLVECGLHGCHDLVAGCLSLDSHLNCSPYVSLYSEGPDHLFTFFQVPSRCGCLCNGLYGAPI